MLINCLANVSVEQNNTIVWVANPFNEMLISESLKHTMNATELLIHNITFYEEGLYACYSEELDIAYKIIDIIVKCKCFWVVLIVAVILLHVDCKICIYAYSCIQII